MSRDITANALTASTSGSGYGIVLMADFDFPSGHVYVHTGGGNIAWNGNTYLGVGHFGGVTNVEESAELRAPIVEFSLSGVQAEYISTAFNENYRHRDVTVYMGFIDSAGLLVTDPVTLWAGRMDTMPITLGESATIRVRAESRLADWERPRSQRYTNEEQQKLFPGDDGLEFVSQMVEKPLVWGRG